MSDAQPPEPIRLVPLVDAAPDASQQSRILTLAAESKIRLYVPVPPAKAVYASSAKLSVSNSMTPTMQQKETEARRTGKPVITNPTPCPEIDFLVLTPKDARYLLAASFAHVRWFPGGLKTKSNEKIQQQGGLEFVPAPLCLCPEGAAVDRGPLTLEAPEHAIRIERRDVLLDRRAMELLADPTNTTIAPTVPTSEVARTGSDSVGRWDLPAYVPFEDVPEEDQPLPPPATWSDKDDPFNLRSRAPGVFVLYVAAKHFFGSEGTDPASQRAVADWIKRPSALVQEWISTLPGQYDKLANKTNTRLANKLLDPEHDERKDSNPKSSATPLSGDALGRAWKYRDGTSYISERFSLVLLAVDYWQQLLSGDVDHDASRIPAKRLTKYVNKLYTEVERYGFITKEEMHAVVKFVIWPYYIPELEKLKAASQAPRGNAKRSH
ncbi:hypothetical protein [Rhodanobacter thiooxydans]|uniref:hypothetical protein n=1 Tax=Rhodanobacter thiooxydans TaxID=416169 RepID=UPI00131ED2F1|nr:hypothetical protein [Rhodanobacter thiooxydans]